ncbi:hypothetical protein G9A89_019841 [Geosiphon pyriformis]|nr:hypothetical protein G9A89_019841 [Geosiphon pyriformis]
MHMYIDTRKNMYYGLSTSKKKRKNTSAPIHTRSHVMASSLTIAKLMNGSLSGYTSQKQLPETQADSSVYAVSIDPGICTPFTWYSPTKEGKLCSCDISHIFHLYKFIDDLCSKEDKLNTSLKPKKVKARKLEKAIGCVH